ncbi:PREDICTED: reticulon-like protein B8 [Tarenaya hassleriana]|uniref:reticulon-like protein B8 n=1 Tax=Tarenaya hassleriana TaxID=28532 RepID=UPI00053C836B|nr:PREDICTED: reticulon-like protein B8 [Tarenaya hassleriana]XP_010552963.1 PREDICTED: reticulon-like protein B8 [Tarenaya hassleriana]
MPEKSTVENVLNDLVETIAESVQKKNNNGSFFEQEATVSSRLNRLFGRQEPIHHVLGGGISADVLLWRNKKISVSVLIGATAVWVLFEWINFHFLTLVCFALMLGMVAQFIWCNASGFLNRSSSKVPRLVLPEEFFVNLGMTIGTEVNRGLTFLQGVACRGNLKQFLMAFGGLWAAAIIGSWCNFLTVLYVGFVAAHTLPVMYERYEDEVDGFAYNLLGRFQNHYKRLDSGFFSRIPRGKKHD